MMTFLSELDLRRYLPLIAAGALLALAGCSTYNSVTGRMIGAITPYRINIVQGNFVSSEAYSQLKQGMTRDQVRMLLGTPLLTDVFHDNRWDYVFYFKRGSTSVVQERRLTLYFDGDHLTRWEGGENLPSEYELVREIDGQKSASGKLPSAPVKAASAPETPENTATPTVAPAKAAPAADLPSAAAGTNPPKAGDASQSGQASQPESAASTTAQPPAGSQTTVPSPPVTSSGGMFTMPQ